MTRRLIMRGACVAATCLSLATLTATASAKDLDAGVPGRQTDRPALVFLVAGQSNAAGTGVLSPEIHKALGRQDGSKGQKKRPLVPGSTASEIGLSTRASDYTHSYIWVPEKGFQPVDPASNLRPNKPNHKSHGMELPVIRELEKRFPDNDVYVVKYAVGGTALYSRWNPTRENDLYARWLQYYRSGMAQLRDAYPEIRVVGLYWDQGESDGIKKQHDAYAKNLTNLIVAFRRDTGVPQLKVFIRKHVFTWPNIDTIIAAQEQVVAKDPNCYLLDIDLGDRKKNYEAWAYSPNNGHVSSKGFVALTERLFEGPLKDASITTFDRYGN